MEHLFFNGWDTVIRIPIIGVASYAALIFSLRISGKRTLSKMNGYDMVVTMALGSVLTKAMLTKDQSVAESVTAIFLLVAFQYIVSVANCRWASSRKLTTAEPALLFHDGEYLRGAMRRERITEAEIKGAVDESGAGDLSAVRSVVLGSNGVLSVIVKRLNGDRN